MDAPLQPFLLLCRYCEVSVSREWTPLYSRRRAGEGEFAVSVSREWSPLYSEIGELTRTKEVSVSREWTPLYS